MSDLLRQVWSRAECEEPVFSAEEIGWGDPEHFQLLCDLGFLKETERALWAQCETCGDSHVEEVVWLHNQTTGNSVPFVPCPATGGAKVSLERLCRWAVDLDAVAKATRHALGLTGNDCVLISGRVWFLGRRQIAGRYRDVFFLVGATREDGYQLWDRCRQIEDAPAPVILVPDQAPSPRQVPILRMSELATLGEGRLSVDLEYLVDSLRQDRSSAPAKTLTSFPVPPDATWAELRLVVREHTIVARLRNHEQELGFEDLGLSGPEDRLWQLLCVLARGGGQTPPVPQSVSEKKAATFRKQVSNLRQRLSTVFAIEGDPLAPLHGTGGYRSLFQINMERHSGFPIPPARWEDCQFTALPDGRIAISVPTKEVFAARIISKETSRHAAHGAAERPGVRTEDYDLRALDLADAMGRPTAEGRVLLDFLHNGGKLTRRGDDMDILRLGRRLAAWMGTDGDPFQFAPTRTLWSTRFEIR
jgi:hypothetical protein